MREARILIVEDEGITALNIKDLLENWGYDDPLIASNSDEAIQNVSKFEPDLILMDINLDEDVDGIEVARNLQNGFDIPIIYLTALSDDEIVERAKLTRYYGYIIKPFDNEELKITIDMALYRHKMEKKLKKANKLLQIELEKRKSAENQLKKSEEKYRTIVETTHEGIVIFNEKNRISYVNEQMAQMMGYEAEEMLGLHVSNFLKDEYKVWIKNELKRRRKGIKRTFEMPLYRKDGSYVWALISGNTLFDSKNQYSGTLGMIKDISERKKAEIRLEENEKKLKKVNDNLELKVQKRTRELKVSNETLKNEIEERKQAKEGKKREHQKLMDIIEFLPDATFVIDQNSNVIAWNRAIEKMTGLSKEEILGKGDYSHSIPFYGLKRPILIDLILSPDDEVEALYDHVEREGDTLYADVFVPDKYGGKFLWGKASPLYDDKGNFVGAIESIRDISKRKKMEEQLKESEAQLKIAMEMAKLVYWEYDVNSDLFTFDDHFYKLYGTTTSKEGGSKMSPDEYARKFLPPEESHKVTEEITKSLETDDPDFFGQVEHTIIGADGEKRFIIVRHGVIKDDKGRTIKTYGANQDITGIKIAEKEIKENLKKLDIINRVILTANRSDNLQSLLEGVLSPVLEFMNFDGGGIYLIDYEKGIARIKHSVGLPPDFIHAVDNVKVSKYPFSEVCILGKSLFTDQCDKIYPEISKSWNPQNSIDFGELENVVKTYSFDTAKTEFSHAVHFLNFKSLAAVPLYSKERIIGSFNLVSKKKHHFTDKERKLINSIGREIGNAISKLITEKKMKKLITELKRSNDELQQFAYITSHDLQEPLRTIASFTQLLERRYKGKLDSDADEFIDYIVEASIRMKQMILDLLEYSRVTRVEKKCEPLKIERVLSNVLDSLNLLVRENNAEITHGILPTVMADENQLFRVFQNLIENAIKFKRDDENPKIYISAIKDLQRNEYIFGVSDNGIGIEEQYFDRIFTLFQRLHTRAVYQGTGIGLSISKRIIENHGGRIWVESEPGIGSTFYFTISNHKLS